MPHIFERDNYTQTVLATHASIPGELLLYGFTVYNNAASAEWIQLFDDGYGVPADGNVPSASFPIAAHSALTIYYGRSGRLCKGGVALVYSTTAATKTIGTAACLFDVQYAHIIQIPE